MHQSIAFFDFDGTITTKDTLFLFIKFVRGKALFYTGMGLLIPILILFKCGILSAQSAKNAIFTFFFRNMTIEVFTEICENFADNVLPKFVHPDAIEKIEWHKAKGHKVVVVSASANNWIAPWCKKQETELLATVLETKNGKITGRISGKNNNLQEKVRRIKVAYNLEQFKTIYAYGDSTGDKPMLKLADKAFFRKFK